VKSPEHVIADFEARRATAARERRRLLVRRSAQFIGLYGVLLTFSYFNARSGSALGAIIIAGAGGYAYVLLRRLWTLEERVQELERERHS
jgi:hypothetical protein